MFEMSSTPIARVKALSLSVLRAIVGQTFSFNCGNALYEQLAAAIRDGDGDLVESIIDEEPELLNGGQFFARRSPIHVAASHGQTQILSMLLDRGVNPNAVNSNGQTPLMMACENGDWACTQPLLEAGANLMVFDHSSSRTCLHYASRSGSVECVKGLLDAARRGPVAQSWGFERFINILDNHGYTALHLASSLGDVGVVRHLLDRGALVTVSTPSIKNHMYGHGSSPIHYAARGGHVECVRELLAWGADRTHRDSMGNTPFGIAMKYNKFDCASLLNPLCAEPLVWPSPWKFMKEGELEPEARTLLEAALEQANNTREEINHRVAQKRAQRAQVQAQKKTWTKSFKRGKKRQTLGSILATSEKLEPVLKEEEVRSASTVAPKVLVSNPIEIKGIGVEDVCCICFERFCTIEVMECGHQMCATCTLSLCCHSKPNPAVPYSPPPSCPFCRRNIGHLIRARPQQETMEVPKPRKSRRSTSKSNSKGGSISSKGSFSGSLLLFGARLGSSKRLGSSGRIVDVDLPEEILT